MAKTAFGATISVGGVTLSEVVTIGPPNRTRETVDVTHHGSTDGYREYLTTLRDGGEASVTMNYVAGSASDDACRAAYDDDDAVAVVIAVKAASGTEDVEFNAFATDYAVDALEIDGKQTATLTLKVTGPITQES